MALPLVLIFIIDLLAIYSLYVIVNISLNLEFGYAGIPNFGKVIPVAVGAFVAGFLPGRLLAIFNGIEMDYIADNVAVVTLTNIWLKNNIGFGFLIFIITIIIAALVGIAVGFLSSYTLVRLKDDYLAVVLLGLGELVRIIGMNYKPIVGGTLGVQMPDPLAWLPGYLRFPIATVGLIVFAILCYIYAEKLVRSPLGRRLRAIRDNDIASSSLGKNIKMDRIKILLIASAMGAIAGALFAFYTGGVIAFAFNRLNWTFWPFVMVLLGGMANNKGVAVGTLIFVTVRKLISFYKSAFQPFIPFDAVWLDLLLLGVVLLLVLVYRPQGLIPEKTTPTVEYKVK